MTEFEKHLINEEKTIRNCLEQLNSMPDNTTLTLFVIDNEGRLLGTLTDGDIRRGFLNNKTIESSVREVMNINFYSLEQYSYNVEEIQQLRKKLIRLVPIVDKEGTIVGVIDLSKTKSLIPADTVIMAGGKGQRLKPLTEDIPKPLLRVGSKPILEHNIDRIKSYGIKNIFISVNYLGEKIEEYFGNGEEKGLNIKYLKEKDPLGTIGALGLVENFFNDEILVMNSDLLTTIDYEDFYLTFKRSEADMAVATTSYVVKVPYAIVETHNEKITSFKEKPTYTYHSNAGLYFLKRSILELIPHNMFFDATDLLTTAINRGMKVISYPIVDYWLDIGKHDDYLKAQEDIKHIKMV